MLGPELGNAEDPLRDPNQLPGSTWFDGGRQTRSKTIQALVTEKLRAGQTLVRAVSQKWWELEQGYSKQEISEEGKYRQLL